MTAVVIALGTVAWFFSLILCVGLARAAALGDLPMERAIAAKRGQRVPAAERRPRVRRAA
jgi:hypothetical protein